MVVLLLYWLYHNELVYTLLCFLWFLKIHNAQDRQESVKASREALITCERGALFWLGLNLHVTIKRTCDWLLSTSIALFPQQTSVEDLRGSSVQYSQKCPNELVLFRKHFLPNIKYTSGNRSWVIMACLGTNIGKKYTVSSAFWVLYGCVASLANR